jgi:hypothetical protein
MIHRFCESCGKLIPLSEWKQNNGKCDECAKEER